MSNKVYSRKILRNIMKKQLGSNKIKHAWHNLQLAMRRSRSK